MPYVPLAWLAEVVDIVPRSTAEDVAAALVKVGLEEEGVNGSGVTGPLVVGRVLSTVEEPQSNGKTINYCRVDVGPALNDKPLNDPAGNSNDGTDLPASRGIVCGAHNFQAGDWVVVALPGAVLPGDFAIAARKTYGHISDGMICSQRELGLGDDHDGIIVLARMGFAADALTPGKDALALLGLGEQTLEITVTPDRGYCFSMRGVGREYSHSTGAAFRDPAAAVRVAAATAGGFPVEIDDPTPVRGRVGCDRFVARIVRGVDPSAPSPAWIQKRLTQSAMRPISLAVDITNYVMLELGQPLHAYDAARVDGPIVVRRARRGADGTAERLTTLDGQDRSLDAEDLLITDSPGFSKDASKRASRVLGLAGVMGGASSEVTEATTDLLIEGAHFDPVTVARTARRHKLGSEASKRFERGVDPEMAPVAVQRVVDLLVEFGGGTADPDGTDLNNVPEAAPIVMPTDFPERIVGVAYGPVAVRESLEKIGCVVSAKSAPVSKAGAVSRSGAVGPAVLTVVPPLWRPDLTSPIDLVEEVARLHGYADLPSVLPQAPAGRGLTHSQRVRRSVARTLAERGLIEVLTYPFISGERLDAMQVPVGDARRETVRLANPLDAAVPFLRTRVLFTLVDAVRVNLGRGTQDVAVFEVGRGYISAGSSLTTNHGVPNPAVDRAPLHEEIADIDASLPNQPRMVAGVMAGRRTLPGWDANGEAFDWTDAIAAVEAVAGAAGVELTRQPDAYAPWHPGRAAAFALPDGRTVAHAGELHPKVCETLGLPARTVAFQVLLDAVIAASEGAVVAARPVLTQPLAKEDFAFVVSADLAAGALVATVREAAGGLLDDARVFDVYAGEQVGVGKKSVAVTVSLRAADHTLSAEEILGVRKAIVAATEKAHGAKLR
jgi:phenylalanyl-tRNA synthetase beta chain